jgi:hypothetical protein
MARLSSQWKGLSRFAALFCAAFFTSGCDAIGITGDDCDGKTYYGPAPCTTDQSCVATNGEGWYCDKGHVVDKACDITWPTCVKR